jgi:hypothetical protein
MADGTYRWIEKPSKRKARVDYSSSSLPKAHEIVDEAAMEKVRAQRFCDICGGWYAKLEAHHIIHRSIIRIDAPWNLLGVCSRCHALCQQHYIPSEVQHALALRRLGRSAHSG